jgi:ATP-dependent RNA helicase RhlE
MDNTHSGGASSSSTRRVIRNVRSKYDNGPKKSFGGGQNRSRNNNSGGYSGQRSSGGFSPGNSRGGSRGGGKRFEGSHIDISKFVNRAVIQEEVEHFIPEHQFIDFLINDSLKKNIVSRGYVTPTPIQDKAIPHILKDHDFIGIANTGTGKTAAFLIPLINKVLEARKTKREEEIMIIVPTRELALQIDQELKSFVFGLKVYSAVCVGGANISRQIADLRYLNNFVIGTPGRLKDLIERKNLPIGNFSTVVLDEADRMLDMGFIKDMRQILGMMKTKRHTMLFSATFSKEIEGLTKEFLTEPVRISVKTQDTSEMIDQDIIKVPPGKDKVQTLQDLLSQPEFSKVLIFGRTKHGVERLSDSLKHKGFRADSIHGDKRQSQREKALTSFKQGGIQALVATDVAARGIDVTGVTHVINFDLPATYEDYVHRIGRTGRGGMKGKALTFVS